MLLCMFSESDPMGLIIGIFAALILVCIILLWYKLKKKGDPRKEMDVEKPEFKDGRLNSQNEMFVNIPRNITYTVGEGKNDMIKPGPYIFKSSTDKESFNVRFNGLVQEFAAGSKVTLSVGDTICCVSDSLVVVADL